MDVNCTCSSMFQPTTVVLWLYTLCMFELFYVLNSSGCYLKCTLIQTVYAPASFRSIWFKSRTNCGGWEAVKHSEASTLKHALTRFTAPGTHFISNDPLSVRLDGYPVTFLRVIGWGQLWLYVGLNKLSLMIILFKCGLVIYYNSWIKWESFSDLYINNILQTGQISIFCDLVVHQSPLDSSLVNPFGYVNMLVIYSDFLTFHSTFLARRRYRKCKLIKFLSLWGESLCFMGGRVCLRQGEGKILF